MGKLSVTPHAAQRMWERFGTNSNLIPKLITASTMFEVVDHHLSYNKNGNVDRKKIYHHKGTGAYFVINGLNRVLTVLTEEMVMKAIKCGKWIVLGL